MTRIWNTLLFLTSILYSALTFSQSAPQGLYYQAVARGIDGESLPNENLSIRLNILEDVTIVYTELHAPTTDVFGLFELIIGGGAAELGEFSNIDWGSNSYFLNIEMDFGTGYESVSTTQFLSVPYSLYAGQAETVLNDNVEDADSDPSNELVDAFFVEDENLILAEGTNSYSIPISELTLDDGDWAIDNENETLSSQNYNVGVNTTNPNSTLSVNGSISVNVQTITSNEGETVETQIGVNNSIVLCDVSLGDIIVNLPEASESTGRTYAFKRFSPATPGTTDSSNTLTVAPQANDQLDFEDELLLDSNDYEQVEIVSDGDNWFIISYSVTP